MCSLDAHKALQLLEEYRKKLEGTENQQLKEALEKAIVAIRSRLFQALLGESTYTLYTTATHIGCVVSVNFIPLSPHP